MRSGSAPALRRRLRAAVAAGAIACASCAASPQERIGRVLEWERRPTAANLGRIREALGDPDPDVRTAALDALITLRDADAARHAGHALDDPTPTIRAAGARGLGELRVAAAVPRLARAREEDAEMTVRFRAVEALEAIGGEGAVAALVAALDDPAAEVRLAAARGCARLDPAGAFEQLARVALDDADWRVRAAAADGLGRSGSLDAVAVLEAARRDPNEFVRAAAASALRTIAPPAGEPETPRRNDLGSGVYSPTRSERPAGFARGRRSGDAAA